MTPIEVWDLKKGMHLFEDDSYVSSKGYVEVLTDAVPAETQPEYFTALVCRQDGYEYTVGANKKCSHYGPRLYLLEE